MVVGLSDSTVVNASAAAAVVATMDRAIMRVLSIFLLRVSQVLSPTGCIGPMSGKGSRLSKHRLADPGYWHPGFPVILGASRWLCQASEQGGGQT